MRKNPFIIRPDQLARIVQEIPPSDPQLDPWQHQQAVGNVIRAHVDGRAVTMLAQFGQGIEPWQVIKTGCALGGLPSTPVAFSPVPGQAWWPLAWITIGLMDLAGFRLISYICENDGCPFVNLTTLPPDPTQKRLVEKSGKEMRGHTDAVVFPFPSEFDSGQEEHSPSPDLLVLVGLRNPNAVPTKLASLFDVLDHLTMEEQEALQLPYFQIRPQRTFETSAVREDTKLLSIEKTGLSLRFSHTQVVPTEHAAAEAKSAHEKITKHLPASYEPVALEPGDVCLVNNRAAIHGRGAPGTDFGGQTRWLLRTYGYAKTTHGKPAGAGHKPFAFL